jgi:hypothetical protein
MSRSLSTVALLCLFTAACGRLESERRNQAGSETGIPEEVVSSDRSNSASPVSSEALDALVGEPLHYGNLTVFPVQARSARTADRFITLEEGLRAGTVEIRETGMPHAANGAAYDVEPADQGEGERSLDEIAPVDFEFDNDVNRLVVVNRSDKPLYLMPGELLIGGSQDRTIAEETIVVATGEPVSIAVYCVEQGHWGGRDTDRATAILGGIVVSDDRDDDPVLAEIQQLAAESNAGKFVATAGHLSKSSRVVAQSGGGQQGVWDEVAKANADSGLAFDTGAFTDNYADRQVVERLQPYLASLSEPVAARERVIGVIVAIDGKLQSADVFESTPLFVKLWPRLLKSYALDALHAADSADAAADDKRESNPATATVADATEFLEDLLAARPDESHESKGGLVVTRRDTKDRVLFSARTLEGAPATMTGGGFGGGGGVHAAGFSK